MSGMNTPDMAAWRAITDRKVKRIKNLNLKMTSVSSVSDTDTELTPCILVTPPPTDISISSPTSPHCQHKLSPFDIHDVQL